MPYKDKEKQKRYYKEYGKIPKVKKRRKEWARKYYQKNKERELKRTNKWKKDNPKKVKKTNKKWREKNPSYRRRYYQKNKETGLRLSKKWYQNNKKRKKRTQKIRNKRSRDKIREEKKKYHQTKKYKEYQKNHSKDRRKKDNNFKIKYYLRNSFNRTLRTYTKTGKIMSSKQYGVDNKAIIEYLEKRGIPKDYSTSKNKYDIHHIKPLHTFNFAHKDGSTNLKAVQRAFLPKNHIILTKKEHIEIHRKLSKNG